MPTWGKRQWMVHTVERPKSLGSQKLRRSFLEEMGLEMATTYTLKARVRCVCPELAHAQKGLREP